MRLADDALGLLEVRGMTAAMGATDAMAKAAPIRLGSATRIGDGLVTIAIHGDIAAVQEALAAGTVVAATLGRLVAAHAIGRPTADLVETFELA